MEVFSEIDNEKVIEEFNRRAQTDGSLGSVLDPGQTKMSHRVNIYWNFISKYVVLKNVNPKPVDNILDFGCGYGRLSSYLRKKAKNIEGVDRSYEMIKIALVNKKKYGYNNINYTNISSSKIPFENNTFNKIMTFWVLQHIDDNELVKILREFYRCLISNDRLYVFEQTRIKRKSLGKTGLHRTVDDYDKILSEAGFKKIMINPVIRQPSYGMHLWKKFSYLPRFFLPVIAKIEEFTINRKPQFVDYYTSLFVYKKISD